MMFRRSAAGERCSALAAVGGVAAVGVGGLAEAAGMGAARRVDSGRLR